MNSRNIHKILGLIFILPMLAWTFTGLFFFIKPGYKVAYQQLPIKTYPLEQPFNVSPLDKWQEARLIHSILGHHLLVTIDGEIHHLDLVTLQPKSLPNEAQYRSLLVDAFSINKQRYGEIVSIKGNHAETTTGVDISLDWDNLSLKQKGQDTKLIGLLYKIHYLQWTPFKGVNQVLGILGLLLLITLTFFGVKILLTKRN